MQQWELLVTDGHVRAARWRKALPVLLGISIVMIVLGVVVARSVPAGRPTDTVANAKTAYAADRRNAVAAFVNGRAQVPQIAPEQAAQAPTQEALAQRLAQTLQALNNTNELPEGVVVQDADDFWRGDWRPAAFHAVREGRTILIGGHVNIAYQAEGYRAPPELRRRFWILRRPEGSWVLRDRAPYGWTAHCLILAGAMPCESDAIEPAAIPATLGDLLPASAFEARP